MKEKEEMIEFSIEHELADWLRNLTAINNCNVYNVIREVILTFKQIEYAKKLETKSK